MQREKIANLGKSADILSLPPTSYSQVLKRKAVDVFIKRHDSINMDSKQVFNTICRKVDPVALNLRIDSTKVLHNSVVMKCVGRF